MKKICFEILAEIKAISLHHNKSMEETQPKSGLSSSLDLKSILALKKPQQVPLGQTPTQLHNSVERRAETKNQSPPIPPPIVDSFSPQSSPIIGNTVEYGYNTNDEVKK